MTLMRNGFNYTTSIPVVPYKTCSDTRGLFLAHLNKRKITDFEYAQNMPRKLTATLKYLINDYEIMTWNTEV